MRMIVLLTAVAQVFCMLVQPVAAGELDAANNAYIRDDYKAAVNLYRPFAEYGNVAAQSQLGIIYYKGGRGVQRDYAEAAKWLNQAADQGLVKAQTLLGLMYCQGTGVPQNNTNCYIWVSLAAIQGDPRGIEVKEIVSKQMTPEQIAEAQRLAQEWLAAHPKN